MCDEEPYNIAFYKGDQIILELVGGDAFKGEYIDGGPHRIDLIKVKQRNNPNELGGMQTFYRNEIENIRISRPKEILKLIEEKKQEEKNKKEDKDIIKIVPEEYYRHREMAKEYGYIDKIDKRYYCAIKRLSDAETIGMFPLGMTPSLDARIQLLAVSTWEEVFLFDFAGRTEKNFYPEIKKILESQYICKVIHNAGPFVHVLKQNYNILAGDVFDTQVVDLILQKAGKNNCPEKPRNLSQCLRQYFNLPKSLIKEAVKSIGKDWSKRPLTDEKKFYASQLATYLVLLRDELNLILMVEADKAFYDIQDFHCSLTLYDLCCLCHKKKLTKSIKKMIPLIESIAKARHCEHCIKNNNCTVYKIYREEFVRD